MERDCEMEGGPRSNSSAMRACVLVINAASINDMSLALKQ
jgi:hypothetical protein